MKCEAAEQAMLLEQSGELNLIQRWWLQAHRARCTHCRQFQADLVQITNDAKAWMPGSDLSGAALNSIRAAAERDLSRADDVEDAVSLRPFAIGQLVAIAAALVLVVLAGWMVILRSDRSLPTAPVAQSTSLKTDTLAWDDNLDNAIAEVGTILTMASEDTESINNGTISTESSDSESLARELLQLEGSQI